MLRGGRGRRILPALGVVTVQAPPFALGPAKIKGGFVMKKLETPPLMAVTGGAGTPPEPLWAAIYVDALDVAAARETWRVVVEELARAQRLSVANGATIERLVRFFSHVHRCCTRRSLAGRTGPGEEDGRPGGESELGGHAAGECRHPRPRG
jgi:hypothetical protein